MFVDKSMTRKVITIDKAADIFKAQDLMAEHNVRHLPCSTSSQRLSNSSPKNPHQIASGINQVMSIATLLTSPSPGRPSREGFVMTNRAPIQNLMNGVWKTAMSSLYVSWKMPLC